MKVNEEYRAMFRVKYINFGEKGNNSIRWEDTTTLFTSLTNSGIFSVSSTPLFTPSSFHTFITVIKSNLIKNNFGFRIRRGRVRHGSHKGRNWFNVLLGKNGFLF